MREGPGSVERWIGRDMSRVSRAYRGSNQCPRDDARLEQGLQHPRLKGAEAAAAREHERIHASAQIGACGRSGSREACCTVLLTLKKIGVSGTVGGKEEAVKRIVLRRISEIFSLNLERCIAPTRVVVI